ncbi:hypothetical protein Ddye_000342 [Dipteronia dyeriana]|uniref:Ubiquitin-like protease family profile domain-containing protein n=1 Tax=Dipteronia dyeriana TaxID=168575 RepID=A0AAE0CT02_9ROSI|nr:hypothetical protein Ddye_000342 [Dipteronia dyeriana]
MKTTTAPLKVEDDAVTTIWFKMTARLFSSGVCCLFFFGLCFVVWVFSSGFVLFASSLVSRWEDILVFYKRICLITDLERGPDPPLVVKEKRDSSGSFRSSMLNGEVRFNNKTLEAIFKAASSNSDEDMVKLALLYFLEIVLFGKDQNLEDLDTFNKYMWSRKCYEITLNSLQRDLRKMAQDYHITSKKTVSGKKMKRHVNKENDGIRQYVLHGFLYAFQIWACEAIPTIGFQTANKFGDLLPRIVNWITHGTPDVTNVIKLLDHKNVVLKKLKPTPRERGEKYVKSLFTAEYELEPPDVDGETEEDIVGINVAENDARLGDKQNRLENAQYKSKHVCPVGSNGEEKGVQVDFEAQEHFEAQLHLDDRTDDESNIHVEKVENNCNTWMSIIVYEKPPPIVPKNRSKKAAALKSPYTDTQIFKPKKLPKFKPLPKLPQTELKKFKAWLQKEDYEDQKYVFVFNCYNYELHSYSLSTSTLGRKVSTITKQEGLWFENDKLFEYAIGVTPRLANPWIRVDKVYLPLNYESTHWILAEIDLIAWKIMVYDSETNLICDRKFNKFNKFMKPLSTMLHLLLQKVKFFYKRPDIVHGGDMTP